MKTMLKKITPTERLLFIFTILFALLRFPSLFEPYWYGDEGIYQIIGVALNNGRELYTQVWDNKPPLLYLIYTLTQGSQFVTRLLSLIVGLATVIVFYALSKQIFPARPWVSAMTTLAFVILFGTPFLEGNIANAENFMLLPILLGMFLSYNALVTQSDAHQKTVMQSLFLIGILFGISFVTKIVGFFEFAAIGFFLFMTQKNISSFLTRVFVLTGGFLIPFLFFVVYFAIAGTFFPFIESVFFSNISYVGYENFLIIPQGLLLLKMILLFVYLMIVFTFRKKITNRLLFLLVWVGFSLFSSFFSHRSYTHYVLLALPSLILLFGYLLSSARKNALWIFLSVLLVSFLIMHFRPYPIFKTISYYPNFLAYTGGRKDIDSYREFFDKRVSRDYAVASYLKMKQDKNDDVFIWGNSAQIYALSETLPVGRYTVSYHIKTPQAIKETQDAINTKKPDLVVILNDEPLRDLSLSDYTYKMSLYNAAFYERTR